MISLSQLLKEVQEKLISIAARNAEQRAEFHSIAGILDKYRDTKDIAQFISDSYHGLRKAWLLIEKTERMVALRIDTLK
jgi:DNA repair ATPase RecN